MAIRIARAIGIAGLCLFFGYPAMAQQVVKVCTSIANSSSGVPQYSCQDVSSTNPFPVTAIPSGTVTPATGTITTTGDKVTLTVPSAGYGTFGIQAVGTWSGALIVEGSVDGTNYTATTASLLSSGQPSTAISAAGAYQGNMSGLKSIQVRAVSMASGSVTITITGSPGTSTIMQDNIPWYTVPGQLTYAGQQTFTTAQLASSQALTIPAGATQADFYPECLTNGTDGQCVRFNPAGAALATGSPGWASQQNILGYSTSGGSWHVILDATATGPASNSALTVVYWK